MAFTTTDLANIEGAIVSLATGTRVVSVSVSNKVVQYQETDIGKLLNLKSIIESTLGTASLRTYAKNGGRAS